MQGIGNDFVMVDTLRDGPPIGEVGSLARAMNDRKFGVGGDGLILLERGESARFKMRMFNPDGSPSEMCGNGIRCLALMIRDHGHSSEDEIEVETGAGTLVLQLTTDGRVRVDMGTAKLARGEIGMAGGGSERFVDQTVSGLPATAVSMGNPHLVLFTPDAAAIKLSDSGPALERHELFPNRVNVHFAEVIDRGRILQRTWERGAGATLACGTGACAVAVSGFVTGRTDANVTVSLPGGDLDISVQKDLRVYMTGPAETVFTGAWQA